MIELKNITYKIKEFGQEKYILKNISCVFEDNCVTAVTGQNGSGKSTLTKIIMGIIKPTSGKVLFDGKDITNLSITERANLGVNYAFQQPVLFKGISVKDLIDVASKQQNSIAKACKFLSCVGLCAKQYIDRDFDKTLSGGEQKRIELALALAKPGKCFIFDEPEAGIDIWSFENLVKIFDKTKCNIIVSHQEKVLHVADKILVLEAGEIKAFGKASEIVKNLTSYSCGKINGDNNGIR